MFHPYMKPPPLRASFSATLSSRSYYGIDTCWVCTLYDARIFLELKNIDSSRSVSIFLLAIYDTGAQITLVLNSGAHYRPRKLCVN